MFKTYIKYFILIFFLSIPVTEYAQRYSIDKKEKKKVSLRINFRKIFIGDKTARTVRKTERKDARKNRKAEKKYQKGIKRYQKKANKPDYMHTNKDAYKKMKKTKKAQKRQFKGKGRDTWIKRVFTKEHSRKKAKLTKEEKKQIRDPFYKKWFKANNQRKRKK